MAKNKGIIPTGGLPSQNPGGGAALPTPKPVPHPVVNAPITQSGNLPGGATVTSGGTGKITPKPPHPRPIGPQPPAPTPGGGGNYPCTSGNLLAFSCAQGFFCAPISSLPPVTPGIGYAQPYSATSTGWLCYFYDPSPLSDGTSGGMGWGIIDSTTFPGMQFGIGCQSGPQPTQPPCDESNYPYCSPSQPPPAPPPQCDSCIDNALNAIAAALQALADQMGSKAGFACSQLDSCMDYIADHIKDKILPPAKTCDQCLKRVELGLATCVECAAISSNCLCQTCVDECSSQDEGNCCTLPDGTQGTCKDDICTPTQPTSTYWIAWCNPDTGDTDATSSDVPLHDPPWQDIGHYPDFQTAANAAQANCTSSQQPTGPQPPSVPPVTPGSGLLQASCNITAYATQEGADSLLAGMQPPIYSDTLIAQSIGLVKEVGNLIGDIPVFGTLLSPLIQTALSPATFADIATDIICGAAGCQSAPLKQAILTLMAVGIGESLTGIDIPQVKLPIEYAINASLRNKIIEPGAALEAYLSNGIDETTAQAAYAAAGYCDGTYDAALQSGRAKPIPQELRSLLNRSIIAYDEYSDRMRQLGYLDQQVVDQLYEAGDIRPSLGEMLHMMIRDADNASVQETFNFDERFDDKFGPTLQRWAQDQQIPLDVVKMAYRSHWDIPSKTELFEFVRRLRNDPTMWSANGWEADLDAALVHNNILPHWIEPYKAILYTPISRMDIRRGYSIGAIKDDDAKNALQQLGYSDDNVDLLYGYLVRLKQQQALKHESIAEWVAGEIDAQTVLQRMNEDGFTDDQATAALDAASIKFASSDAAKAFIRGELDRDSFNSYLSSVGLTAENVSAVMDKLAFVIRDRETEKEYVSGLVDRSTAQSNMVDSGVAPSVASTVLDSLDAAIEVDTSNKCRAAIKKQFLTGGLDVDGATQKLLDVGIVQPHADRFVSSWQCEQHTKDKSIPAATLCTWFGKGAITAEDYVTRLTNIGFSRDDALQLLSDCSDRIQTKQAAQQAKQAAQQEADKRKQQAAADRAVAKGEKVLAQLAKARAEKARLLKQRQTQFLQVSKNVEKKTLATPGESVTAVLDQSNSLQAAGFSLDESLRIMLQASEAIASGVPLATWLDLVAKFSSVVASTEFEAQSESESNIPS